MDPTELIDQICDIFGIGSAVRTPSTILANVQNAARRSLCLNEIEAYHSVVETDEDGDEIEECVLMWGDDPWQYIERYKELMSTLQQNTTGRGGEET